MAEESKIAMQPGEYLLEIIEVSKVPLRHSAGWRFSVAHGVLLGPEPLILYRSYPAVESALPYIQELFEACGLPDGPGTVSEAEGMMQVLVGRTYTAVVSISHGYACMTDQPRCSQRKK